MVYTALKLVGEASRTGQYPITECCGTAVDAMELKPVQDGTHWLTSKEVSKQKRCSGMILVNLQAASRSDDHLKFERALRL